MSTVLPLRLSNADALALSQEASDFVKTNTSWAPNIPLPLISSPESPDLWANYERYLVSCLRTGNDKAAHLCLERLLERFGSTNERVMGLRGLYQEATAHDDAALGRILQEYSEVLAEDSANVPIAKRRIALLRSLGRISDAIDALIELLESSPTDVEAWAELSELYDAQGLQAQAIFCLEEVLTSAPYAWNIQVRLAEILLVSSKSNPESPDLNLLSESIRRFCRSIELCDGYLRGYYGLKLATDSFLHTSQSASSKKQLTAANNDNLPLPTEAAIQRLNELATSKLADIIRTGEKQDYDAAELDAVRALLDRSTQAVTR